MSGFEHKSDSNISNLTKQTDALLEELSLMDSDALESNNGQIQAVDKKLGKNILKLAAYTAKDEVTCTSEEDYELELGLLVNTLIREAEKDLCHDADNEGEGDEISTWLGNRIKKTKGLRKKKNGQSKDPRKLNKQIQTRIFVTSCRHVVEQTIIMDENGRPTELEECLVDPSMVYYYTTTEESDGYEFLVLRVMHPPPNDAERGAIYTPK